MSSLDSVPKVAAFGAMAPDAQTSRATFDLRAWYAGRGGFHRPILGFGGLMGSRSTSVPNGRGRDLRVMRVTAGVFWGGDPLLDEQAASRSATAATSNIKRGLLPLPTRIAPSSVECARIQAGVRPKRSASSVEVSNV